MAGKPQDRQMVQAERKRMAGSGDPLFSTKMRLSDRSGSIGLVIPSVATEMFGFEIGDMQRVEVHDNGVFIPTESNDE